MLLWSIDGSTTPLPNTVALKEKFGCPSNQFGESNPAARICVLYDVLNQLCIKGLLHPFTDSEENVVLDVLQGRDLGQSLLLLDRGYPSYWLMERLMKKQTHFVMRVQRNANKRVSEFIDSAQSDITVELLPSYKSIARLKEMEVPIEPGARLKVRYVKVPLPSGEVEVLATNLYDSSLCTLADLKEVYFLRWGIETFYGYIKEELELGQFSGIREVCIQQDFAANLFLFNLQSLIEKQCDSRIEKVCKKRAYKYKVNKNISWASLKYRVVNLFLEEPPDVLLELEKLFCKYLEPIRKGRKYHRVKRQKPNAKYYTLTNYKRVL